MIFSKKVVGIKDIKGIMLTTMVITENHIKYIF